MERDSRNNFNSNPRELSVPSVDMEGNGIDLMMENILMGEQLKTLLQVFVNKPVVNSDKISINSIRHQNVTIIKKKKNKNLKDGYVETYDIPLL